MTEIQISETLRRLLDELADSVITAAELVDKVREQAEIEHLSPSDIRELIVSTLKKRRLSARTIAGYLPEDLKDPVKKDAGSTPKSIGPDAAAKTAADNRREIKPEIVNTSDGRSLAAIPMEQFKELVEVANEAEQLKQALKEKEAETKPEIQQPTLDQWISQKTVSWGDYEIPLLVTIDPKNRTCLVEVDQEKARSMMRH